MYILVLTTAPTLKEARALTESLLKRRLAACINILPAMESHYHWKNKKVKGKELLLMIKTRENHFKRIEQLIQEKHSYTLPEIISIPVTHGNCQYLDWISSEVR